VFADDASESSQGVKLLQEAAERGDTDAKSNLGFCYYSGKGVEQDYSEAVKWWRKAVEQDDEEANEELKKLEK